MKILIHNDGKEKSQSYTARVTHEPFLDIWAYGYSKEDAISNLMVELHEMLEEINGINRSEAVLLNE